METSSTKELILSRIRKALAIPTTLPYPRNETELPLFPEVDDDLSVIFATEFSRLLGQFAYCSGEEDLVAQLSLLIQKKGWQNIYSKEKSFVELFRRRGLDVGCKNRKHLVECCTTGRSYNECLCSSACLHCVDITAGIRYTGWIGNGTAKICRKPSFLDHPRYRTKSYRRYRKDTGGGSTWSERSLLFSGGRLR